MDNLKEILEEAKSAFGAKDYQTAFEIWKSLAEQRNAEAQFNLGRMYSYGRGVKQNHKKAVKWYQLAGEQKNAEAQFNCGLMHHNGLGVKQDHKEAVKWYQLAGKQGNAEAQINLGRMYANGRGILKDYKEAVKWYRLAAEQGNAEAQINLDLLLKETENTEAQNNLDLLLEKKGDSADQVINGHDVSNLFDLNKEPYSFDKDHNEFIPEYGSMIYTVWDSNKSFIYVGICGLEGERNPRNRITQHRSGRRSGDQFCTYIQDFYVLSDILNNGTYEPRKKWLDDKTKNYIRERLFYRFVVIEEITRTEVVSIENRIREGVFGFPPPVLNGLPDSW